MGVKMNLRIITKNHDTNLKIGFLTKSISRPYCRATAMPPAWELRVGSYGFIRCELTFTLIPSPRKNLKDL